MANTRELAQELFRRRVGDHDFSLQQGQLCYVSPANFIEDTAGLLDEVRREVIEECAKAVEADPPADMNWTWSRLRVARRVRALAELRPVPDGAAPEGSGK